MSFLFSSPPPTYAEEKLHSQLASLSTLPINLTTPLSPSKDRPSPALETALTELTASKPPSRQDLRRALQALIHANESSGGVKGYVVQSEVDRAVESEVIARALTIVWKEVLDDLLSGALKLEKEKVWWDSVLNSRQGVAIYLLQTLPHRFVNALPPRSSLTLHSFTQVQTSSLFPKSPSSALSTLTSPYTLTRREVLASRKEIITTRDTVAQRIGTLAADGPKWAADQFSGDLAGETARLYAVLSAVLEIPPPASPSRRSKSSTITSSPGSHPSATALVALLDTHLPRCQQYVDKILNLHHRPSALTRLWFPLLFLPPALYAGASIVVNNKEWMKEQVKNAKETVRGFFISWVWEPIEDIGKTLRGGGEGLGVAPTTVKSDQESLERMVLDLGRDYYHMSPPELNALSDKIKSGDMEDVLRVYEKELQSPVKNALLGSLIRTLLIQVQKTKTDLSLSLLSLDHLLRSQQLTFAFVGVAPSVLVLYGLGGWLRSAWRGEKRGKSRRRTYFTGVRDIERLLLTSPKREEQMTNKDRGLLIVGVSSMRSWAAGLSGGSKEGFLEDLRMIEEPVLSRSDKLRVVERIWRCWGMDGRRKM